MDTFIFILITMHSVGYLTMRYYDFLRFFVFQTLNAQIVLSYLHVMQALPSIPVAP